MKYINLYNTNELKIGDYVLCEEIGTDSKIYNFIKNNIPFNFEYNENDYVLIKPEAMPIKPDLLFAKIIEIPFLNYNTTDTITVEMTSSPEELEIKLQSKIFNL